MYNTVYLCLKEWQIIQKYICALYNDHLYYWQCDLVLGDLQVVRSWETWVQSSEETRWWAGFWFVWIESQDSGLFDSEFGVKTEIWIWNQAGNQFLLSAAITIGCYCLVLLSVILCNMVLGFCLFVLLWIKDVLLCVILYLGFLIFFYWE